MGAVMSGAGFLFFLLSWLCLFFKRKELIIVLLPLFLKAYTGIVAGVFWIDIACVLWVMIGVKYIRRIGIFSLCCFIACFTQIIINVYFYETGAFFSFYTYDYIFTPLHQYIPLILLILYFENTALDLIFFSRRYKYLLLLCLIFILATRFFCGESFRGDVPIIASIATFISFFTPFLLWHCQVKDRGYLWFVIIMSLIILSLLETRGAIISFMFLLFVTYIPIERVVKSVKAYILLFMIFCGAIYFFEFLPDNFKSISNLYFYLFTDNDTSNLDLINNTGDKTRFILWTYALQVWLKNIIFGIGTNQFLRTESVEGISDSVVLSPHHAFFDYAVSGGLLTVFIYYFPVLYMIYKKKKHFNYSYLIIFIVCSFVMGYSFPMVYLIMMYCNGKTLKSEVKHEKKHFNYF